MGFDEQGSRWTGVVVTMKNWILWSFERGSKQYDIICAIILAVVFLTPPTAFNDKPDFMRLPEGQEIRKAQDDAGNTVFTVKVEAVLADETHELERAALDRLKKSLDGPFTVARMQPIYDTTGALVAYSFWVNEAVHRE